MRKIVLFDIDRTLIYTKSGRYAMNRAFKEIYGISDGFKDIMMSGKPDPWILLEAIKKNNLETCPDKMDQYKDLYLKYLCSSIKNNSPEEIILPGVKKLLFELHKYENIKMGILTGNWEAGAKIKLNYCMIGHYFNFGAFGDDSANRDDLLPFALRRHNGANRITANDSIIIGDTPADIRCAKIHGAKAIGVATGRYSIRELKQKDADFVVKDLTETDFIINWIIKK